MTQGWYGIAERVPKLMEKSDPMKIGIIIDGKFGDHAFRSSGDGALPNGSHPQ
jgi:hypothetical protein